MKKILSLLLCLLLCVLCLPALGESDTAATTQVSVSITDDTGALVLALETVLVTDTDGDAVLTINDALACAHAAHPDGAEAYSAVPTEWGLSLMKLWGVENGGSYGYYLNDASAWSLLDPVKEGDHVKAYAFTDLNAFSDTYCYFDTAFVETSVGETVELTLTAAAFDENFAPITVPVAGAALVIDGEKTDIVTDEAGCVSLTVVEAGSYLSTARSAEMVLVPPVCVIKVQ
ncbi:MAG: hypothetical protein J6A48_07325 [Clostridia bacterium]|nr:hypothetical protein [Clostridia bacterium]